MSTRSLIVCDNHAVYCHFDGHPEGAGMVLCNYYTDSDKVEALIAHGDMSVLGIEIGSKIVDYDTYIKYDDNYDVYVPGLGNLNRQCIFYHRDCEEAELTIHNVGGNNLYNIAEDCGAEYVYVFSRTTCTWNCFEVSNGELKSVNIPTRNSGSQAS